MWLFDDRYHLLFRMRLGDELLLMIKKTHVDKI